jgi:hypothetical protein
MVKNVGTLDTACYYLFDESCTLLGFNTILHQVTYNFFEFFCFTIFLGFFFFYISRAGECLLDQHFHTRVGIVQKSILRLPS